MDRGDVYSTELTGKSGGKTGWLGMNFSASAFGVSCVWMNIVRAVSGTLDGNVAVV